MNEPPIAQRSSRFRLVVQISSALGVGSMAVFFCSLRQVNPELRFELGPLALLGFIAAVMLSVSFWRVAFETNMDPRRRSFRFVCLGLVMVVSSLIAMVYGLKDVSREKAIDVAEGVFGAFVVLGGIGWIFWQIVGFLERDYVAGENPGPPKRKDFPPT